MGAEWYYSRGDGQQMGPVSSRELKQLAASGGLSPADFVWREGLPDWVEARQLKGAFDGDGASAERQPAVARPMGGMAQHVEAEAPAMPAAMFSAPAFVALPAVAQAPARVLNYRAPQAAQRLTTDLVYAGFWLRFVAHIVDQLIVRGIGFIVNLAALSGLRASGAANDPGAHAMIFVAQIVLEWLYYAIQESSVQQATIGKRLMGLTVVDLDCQRISFGRATGRHFAKILSVLTFLIGFVMAGFTSKKQALHDMIASTLVVR